MHKNVNFSDLMANAIEVFPRKTEDFMEDHLKLIRTTMQRSIFIMHDLMIHVMASNKTLLMHKYKICANYVH